MRRSTRRGHQSMYPQAEATTRLCVVRQICAWSTSSGVPKVVSGPSVGRVRLLRLHVRDEASERPSEDAHRSRHRDTAHVSQACQRSGFSALIAERDARTRVRRYDGANDRSRNVARPCVCNRPRQRSRWIAEQHDLVSIDGLESRRRVRLRPPSCLPAQGREVRDQCLHRLIRHLRLRTSGAEDHWSMPRRRISTSGSGTCDRPGVRGE